MGNNLKLLGTLQDKLINSQKFSEVMTYFFDNFAENLEFLQVGDLQQSDLVETLVVETASKALGKRVKLRELNLVYLPKERFYHGAGFVDKYIVNLFFFEEIMTGMMGICVSPITSEVLFARITTIRVKDHKAKWN